MTQEIADTFRQTTDGMMQGLRVGKYAEDRKKLKAALTKWGIGRIGFQTWAGLHTIS